MYVSEEKKDNPVPEPNITNIDEARVRRLKQRGHMMSIVDEFEKLRLKFFYERAMTKVEAMRFVTLCKFLMDNGPTEPFRLSCRYLYEKYMEKYNL